MDLQEAIYLIYPREYIDTKENIYKVGMTTRMVDNRLAEYSKGSMVLLTRNINNAKEVEKTLLKIFINQFILVKGREYFKGDYKAMIKIINDEIDIILNDEEKKINNTIKQSYICDACGMGFDFVSHLHEHHKSITTCIKYLNKIYKIISIKN